MSILYKRKAYRIIPRKPENRIWYLIDSNFLINKYLDSEYIQNPKEKKLVEDAHYYWSIIDEQIASSKATVLILDVCIAETFKNLAKKEYFKPCVFPDSNKYHRALRNLRKDLQLRIGEARRVNRKIQYHDIQTNRDIIIGVDRYFEQTYKKNIRVTIIDLMILSTSKYLQDFFGFSKDDLFIITQDGPLYKLAKMIPDIPKTFNPSAPSDLYKKVFI